MSNLTGRLKQLHLISETFTDERIIAYLFTAMQQQSEIVIRREGMEEITFKLGVHVDG
jgi:mannitol-1-phosphate/altronate dehydrogenase